MKDINFFLPFVEKRKVKFNNTFFLSILFLLFALSVIGYGTINHLKINKLQAQTAELRLSAKDPKIVAKVEEIRAEEEELNRLTLEVEEIQNLKVSVEEKDIIGADYINNIIMKRPIDLFLTNLYITQESVSITGITNNRLSVAEFAKGLKEIESLGDIFVSSISREESKTDYNFNLETSLTEEIEVEVEADGTIKESEDSEEVGEEE